MHISKYFEENIPFFNAFDMLGQSIHILNSTAVQTAFQKNTSPAYFPMNRISYIEYQFFYILANICYHQFLNCNDLISVFYQIW